MLWLLNKILPSPHLADGERLTQALLAMGPVYIKLGQLLSTRRDLLPAQIIDHLETLQDNVPPIENFDINKFLQDELGEQKNDFTNIENAPLAAASIAQIHCAQLAQDGTRVVVKLVRPGIRQQIEQDMVPLQGLARNVTRFIPDAKRLHLERIVQDHKKVLIQELDMEFEATNQIQLRRNFANSNLLYVPRVFTNYNTSNILVMEYVDAPSIGDMQTLQEHQVDFKVLAHKGVTTFFTQVFEHNFFHADMHPGNILIDVSNPKDPKYVALDCAIIGQLTKQDQHYLAHNLIAFFNRDYKQVVNLHLQSGWIPANTDAQAFEQVIKEVCDPIFAKPLNEISFGDFVLTLFQTAGQFNMEIQPQLVLLQKTLLYIEGVGRTLYPQLDLWETAQPFMNAWAEQQLGPSAVAQEWLSSPSHFWHQLAHLPNTLEQNDVQILNLRAKLEDQNNSLARLEKRAQQTERRNGLLGLAILILGITLWVTV